MKLQRWEERRDEIEALIRQVFGDRAAIGRMEKITERTAAVSRLHLIDAPVASVIAKFAPEPIASPPGPGMVEFAEEMLAQRFLATLPMARKIKPDLLGFAPEGIFLLEDLGTRAHDGSREFDYLIPRLSETFATLHAAGRGHFDEYCELRADAGLGGPENDIRRNGKPAYRSLFALGGEFILTRHELFAVRNSRDAIGRELQGVEQLVAEPGRLLTFIHDDLGNARQTFEVGESIYLLDFEYAKYSHALLEFAKPLMGKIEFSLKTGEYAWTGPLFPLELIRHYRRVSEVEFGFHVEDDVWRQGVDATLAYGAITLVGRLYRFESDARLKGTAQWNIQAILQYLGTVLAETGGLPALQSFSAGYTSGQ